MVANVMKSNLSGDLKRGTLWKSLIRLSWSIDVEINGEWPWQRARFHKGEPPGPDEV
jgi:hypothetical protein